LKSLFKDPCMEMDVYCEQKLNDDTEQYETLILEPEDSPTESVIQPAIHNIRGHKNDIQPLAEKYINSKFSTKKRKKFMEHQLVH
jgi:hypothetical protein